MGTTTTQGCVSASAACQSGVHLQGQRFKCFSVIMTTVMWKHWIFTLGLTLFSLLALTMTSSPNMLRRDLTFIACGNHCSTTAALFFLLFFFFLFFKSAGITGKMREKSHLSSVQQKQHILTSHWVCKMWFPEKGRTPPTPTPEWRRY